MTCPRPHSKWQSQDDDPDQPVWLTGRHLPGVTGGGTVRRGASILLSWRSFHISVNQRILPEVADVPKTCFRPVLEKETSIFTAETAFLLTWAFLGRSSVGALCRMALPCQVSCQAFRPERCKTAKVEVGKDTECICVSVRFPGTSIWGRRVLDGCGLAAGAEGRQLAQQDQEGDWKWGVSRSFQQRGGARTPGPLYCPVLQGHVPFRKGSSWQPEMSLGSVFSLPLFILENFKYTQ